MGVDGQGDNGTRQLTPFAIDPIVREEREERKGLGENEKKKKYD